MRRSLLLAPLALLSFAACAKAAGGAAATEPAPSGPVMPAGVTEASIAVGDSIYHSGGCQRCHGQKGVGAQNGPSLVEGPWLQAAEGRFEAIVGVITNGVPRTALKDQSRRFPMNPRGGPMNLNDDQVKAVAAYVWSISRGKQ